MAVTAPQAFCFTSEFFLASISTILYSRSLLPEDCFEDTEYFVNGFSYKRKTLRSGASDESDGILSLIEDKVFARLKTGKIGFVRLFVADTIDSPDSSGQKKYVFEVYSIEIRFPLQSYGENLRRIAIEENPISIAAVNEQLYTTTRRHLDVTGSLRSLSTKHSYLVAAGVYGDAFDIDTSQEVDYSFRHSLLFHECFQHLREIMAERDKVQHDLGTMNTFYVSSKVWMMRIQTDRRFIQDFPGDCECLAQRFGTIECTLCSRRIHKRCYGAYESSRQDITCYTCIFGKTNGPPSELKSIMRIRYLWRYVSNFYLCKSTDEFKSFFPDFVDITMELNTMIKHSILEISDTILQLPEDNWRLKWKADYVKIGMKGLKKENGEPLIEGQSYYFIFSPRLCNLGVAKLKYKRKTLPLFFPKVIDTTKEEAEKRCREVFGR